MNNLLELKQQREEIDKRIAELEAKEWPKKGDIYYSASYFEWEFKGSVWSNDACDLSRKKGLGVYRTAEEAKHYFNYFKLLREIDAFCDERNPEGWDWREVGCVWGIEVKRDSLRLEVYYFHFSKLPMFGKLKEEHHAKELLEKFGARIMEVINFKN